jgi:hypothetical protein
MVSGDLPKAYTVETTRFGPQLVKCEVLDAGVFLVQGRDSVRIQNRELW